MDFVKNLEVTHIVGGGGTEVMLFHYDALRTKIDMWLTPYLNIFVTIEKMEPRNYD